MVILLGVEEIEMRMARIKNDGEGWYHIVSRTAFQLFKFGEGDKCAFVRMMRRAAAFSGVEVLNHCVMSNHFHILLHVPKPEGITEEELLRRVAALYGGDYAKWLGEHWAALRKGDRGREAEREQARLRRRMGDMSEFMKTLKQRYSLWYRHQHGEFSGTLWEGRFKSVILQGDPATLSAVSAYIDLNPVRARIVDDPAKYKWSGYGAAMAGNPDAMRGIARVFREDATDGDFVKIAEENYRTYLYEKGGDSLSPEKVKEVLDRKGRLTMRQLLRCRVRHFIAGTCMGDAEFVEGVFRAHRDHFGKARKTGARSMGGGLRLYTARRLTKAPVTLSC